MKKDKYSQLVCDVEKCTLCDEFPQIEKGNVVILEHDTNREHINLWSH